MRINSTPRTPQQEKALTLRAQYQETVERIRADKTLSPIGKQQRLAAQYLRFKPELKKLEAEQETTQQARLASLRKELFGITSSSNPYAAIEYRDAQDRAARLDNEEAARALLNQADLGGDTTLAKAVAARSFEQGWSAIINQYSDMNPTSGPKFNELLSLENRGQGSADIAQLLGDAMTFNVEKPSEFGYSTERDIAAIAEG